MLLIPSAHRGQPAAARLTLVAAALAVLAWSPAGAQTAAQATAQPAAQSAARPVPAAPSAPRAPAVTAPVTSSPCLRLETGPTIQVAVGKSTILKPGRAIARILLGNPDASPPAGGQGANTGAVARPGNARPGVGDVEVLLLGPTEVFVLGKALGTTNVVMLDRQGECTAYDVVVGMDTVALQSVIQRLLPDEKDIKVSAAFDAVVLSGTVRDSESVTRVTDLAHAYVRGQQGGATGPADNPRIINMMGVSSPQQVMLEVKVAEIAKSLLDQFGIDFSRAYTPGDSSMIRFLSGVFGGAALTSGQLSGTGPGGVPLSSVGTAIGGTINGLPGVSAGNVTVDLANGVPKFTTEFGTVPARGVTNVNGRMQKTDGLIKVLAEPTVMALSSQTGSFLAGGKIFIPVSQSNGDGTRNITLEEKEFGVSVKFTPTVLANGLINLRVRPEVSELNTAGVTITGIGGSAVLPSFTSRKAETTVQLMDGQSFAIGGLIKNNTTTNVRSFPFLGEIPVLGALFRSTEFQTDRSELVFVITPRLVKPLPPDYRLPTDAYVPPTRQDLILHGRTEGQPPAQGGFDLPKDKP